MFVSCPFFDLKSKCLQRAARTNEVAVLFQYLGGVCMALKYITVLHKYHTTTCTLFSTNSFGCTTEAACVLKLEVM